MSKCYFCSKEAITSCYDCGKPLCENHKYAPLNVWSRDRCQNCNNIHIAQETGKSVVKGIRGLWKLMN